MVFASHATSKLRDADDLFRIGTLGFRGEAMASIGGVAQVTIQSRAVGPIRRLRDFLRRRQAVRGSALERRAGTRVEVRHLFFNTPVRKKFLRTIPTELGHVVEAVTRLGAREPGLAHRLAAQ